MGAGRADALVLVVDAGARAERLLQLVRPDQGRRPPLPIDVEHLARDVDVPLRGDLLEDQLHREQRLKRLRADRLVRARVQGRRRRHRQVGDQVVPGRGHLVLGQEELVGAGGLRHGGKGTERCMLACHALRRVTRAHPKRLFSPVAGRPLTRAALEVVVLRTVHGVHNRHFRCCRSDRGADRDTERPDRVRSPHVRVRDGRPRGC